MITNYQFLSRVLTESRVEKNNSLNRVDSKCHKILTTWSVYHKVSGIVDPDNLKYYENILVLYKTQPRRMSQEQRFYNHNICTYPCSHHWCHSVWQNTFLQCDEDTHNAAVTMRMLSLSHVRGFTLVTNWNNALKTESMLYISVIDLNYANIDVYKLIYRPMHLISVTPGHRHHNILLKESQLHYSLFSAILISAVYSCGE